MENNRRELTPREIQLATLDIVEKIDEICASNGFEYWLYFGSLLGAVRHKGYIPWDDDFDICMPRDDYNRFLEFFKNNPEELSPLVCLDGFSEGLSFLITRITDTRYSMEGEHSLDNPILGTFVDVYPLDGLGSDVEQAILIKARCKKAYTNYARAGNFAAYNIGSGPLKSALKRLRGLLLGNKLNYRDSLGFLLGQYSFQDSEYVACALWDTTLKVYRRAVFDTTIRVPFEGLKLPIPGGYDELLTVIYGDYMEPPAQQDRVPHHAYKIIAPVSEDSNNGVNVRREDL